MERTELGTLLLKILELVGDVDNLVTDYLIQDAEDDDLYTSDPDIWLCLKCNGVVVRDGNICSGHPDEG